MTFGDFENLIHLKSSAIASKSSHFDFFFDLLGLTLPIASIYKVAEQTIV